MVALDNLTVQRRLFAPCSRVKDAFYLSYLGIVKNLDLAMDYYSVLPATNEPAMQSSCISYTAKPITSANNAFGIVQLRKAYDSRA